MKIVTTQISSVISNPLFSCLCLKKSVNGRFGSISMAKKDGFSQKSTLHFPLKFSKKIVSQAVIGVLGLGFIDAGYSGDWSRIGVISKESEDLLKVGAFLVVPMCFFFIFFISKANED